MRDACCVVCFDCFFFEFFSSKVREKTPCSTTPTTPKKKTLLRETREGRRLSFALALQASPGALTGPRAHLLISLLTPAAVTKEKEEQRGRKRERERPFARGIGSVERRLPSTTLSFSFFLFFHQQGQDGLHGPLLHVPPRRRVDRSHVPRRGRVSFRFYASSRKKKKNKEKEEARKASIDDGRGKKNEEARAEGKKKTHPPKLTPSPPNKHKN